MKVVRPKILFIVKTIEFSIVCCLGHKVKKVSPLECVCALASFYDAFHLYEYAYRDGCVSTHLCSGGRHVFIDHRVYSFKESYFLFYYTEMIDRIDIPVKQSLHIKINSSDWSSFIIVEKDNFAISLIFPFNDKYVGSILIYRCFFIVTYLHPIIR